MTRTHTYRLDSDLRPDQAVTQIADLVRNGEIYKFGTFSGAIYDTAWVSMVHKVVNDRVIWPFRQCFKYILDTQDDRGTWSPSTTSIDAVLSTAASLLSLITHHKLRDEASTPSSGLESRIDSAQRGLQSLLEEWNVETTDAVGFEILVPSLLRQLGQAGLHFDFPGRKQLDVLYEKKIRKFRPEMVYSTKLLTLHHSLEAFIGLIDFDKVRHHCRSGVGMLASPASTVAYLMNSSTWDETAESYLRDTLEACGGSVVPSAFPTCIFETSWALSTLLEPSIMRGSVKADDANTLISFFTRVLDNHQGVTGFTVDALEDADDTARVLLTLRRLGKPYDHGPMIRTFESQHYFRTYELESNPSFSANCNVLLALLEHGTEDMTLTRQIHKALSFLLDLWESGTAEDKWNLSPHYVFMLFSAVLVRVLNKYDRGDLGDIPLSIGVQRPSSAICQMLSRILSTQREDGCWDGSREITSYSVIAIAQCLALPWLSATSQTLKVALERGRSYLNSNLQFQANDSAIWIEKVTYTSSLLQSTYCLSAMRIQPPQLEWGESIENIFNPPNPHTSKIKRLMSKLPLLQTKIPVCIDLAIVEAMNNSSYLRDARLDVFPRDQMPVSTDKYLEYIPILWAVANQVGRNILRPALVKDMLLQSMFIYQVDEYMESVVAGLTDEELLLLDLDLQKACNTTTSTSAHILAARSSAHQSNHSKLGTIRDTLMRYVDYTMSHPATAQLPHIPRNELTLEIYNFLHAHIMQTTLNRQLVEQRLSNGVSDQRSQPHYKSDYMVWVRTLGANTTSCPMAFRLFTCLADHYSGASKKPSRSPAVKYCLDALGHHLAIMCRQYNDVGSAARDEEEGNLNSLDFSLFDSATASSHENCTAHVSAEAKDQLIQMANVERTCVGLMKRQLPELLTSTGVALSRLDEEFLQHVEVFIDVTDLFGQMYIIKDVSSRMQQ